MRTPIRTMTDDPILHRIMDLLKRNGNTEKDLLRHVKLKDTTFIAGNSRTQNRSCNILTALRTILESALIF